MFSAIKTGRRAAVLLAALCFIGSARADSGRIITLSGSEGAELRLNANDMGN